MYCLFTISIRNHIGLEYKYFMEIQYTYLYNQNNILSYKFKLKKTIT